MRRGLTLTEILITIIILAVLAAIAIPSFSNAKAKNDASQAVTYLRAIKLAEQMYYAKNATYLACANATAIKTNLGVEITAATYSFDVTSSAATTFLARAVKGSAPPADCTAADTLCLDQNGNWTGASVYKPTI